MNKNIKSSLKLAMFASIVFGLGLFFNIGEASAEVTAGLVGHYKFDEGSGASFSDSSVNNNNPGTCSGSGCPSYTAGKLGTALQFDGTDDYINYGNVPSLKIFPSGNWSVSTWIKPTGSSTYTEGIIFMGDYQIPGIWYETQRNSILMDMRRTNGNIDWIARTNSGTILPNGWHHLVVTADQANYRIYLDGVQSTSVLYEAMYTAAATAYVSGGRNDAYGHYNGAIDDVRVYNRPLTQQEITELANPAPVAPMQRLQVSPNRRFLVKEDGTPFFWMGDTTWSIVTIPPADVDLYLNNRSQKGFNLIHIDTDAYGANNYNGARPFSNDNTDTPNSTWWNYVDEIITKAGDKDIYVCIFPMWSQVWDKTRTPQYFGGYRLFNGDTNKATRFGEWIGNRYKNRTNVLWSVAGEFDKLTGTGSTAIYEAVAQGIETAYQNAGLSPLMTIHPAAMSYYTSSYKFHNSSWLDFNMLQTGHTADLGPNETYNIISHDYNLTPSTPKPTIEGEPTYEGIVRWDGGTIPNNEAVSRRKIYWSVFAGGFGVTYGHGSVQKMNNPLEDIPLPWKDALNAPVGGQMIYLRNLMESLPDYFNRVPDQSVVTSLNPAGIDHVQATRDADGKYALVYIPNGATVTVDMSKINGGNIEASWYSPRDGSSAVIPNVVSNIFDPPGSPAEGNDWVLVLKQAGTTAQCFDGADNDFDDKIDFGYGPTNDSGCTHYGDDDESSDPTAENGLVARWTMDANHINDNIAFDSSTFNNHGAVNGTVDSLAGKTGQARLFNGTTDIINVSHDTTLVNSSGTFTAWFKSDDLNKKSQAIIGKDASGCVGDCGHFYVAYNDEYYSTHAPYVPNKLFVRFQNNGTSYFLYNDDAKGQIKVSTWHHMAVTFGTGGLKLYVDGVLHDTDSHSEGVAGNSETLSVGNYYEPNYGFKGSLDDVRVYNRVLIDMEIKNLPGFFKSADVNGDGQVNIKDIQICIKAIVDPNSFITLDQLNQLAKCQAVAPPIDVVNIKDIQGIIREIVNPSQ